MIPSIVYNIPALMAGSFPGRNIVVRSADPSEIIQSLEHVDVKRLSYLQILGTGGAIDSLMRWEYSTPIDLVIQDPVSDLPQLYRYSPLVAERPVRVTVRVAPGFSKLVKLALSLNFAVKLEILQPEPDLIEELLQVASLYLHSSTVSQPVEFIHSIFWSFYNKHPVTLWTIQEEDPACMRYITDIGTETISQRLTGVESQYPLSSFVEKFTEVLRHDRQECGDCEFFVNCAGYFKWPMKDYRCSGMKYLFHTLWTAAEELRADIASIRSPEQDNRP